MNKSRLSISSVLFVSVIILIIFGASRLVKINKEDVKNSTDDFRAAEYTLGEEDKLSKELLEIKVAEYEDILNRTVDSVTIEFHTMDKEEYWESIINGYIEYRFDTGFYDIIVDNGDNTKKILDYSDIENLLNRTLTDDEKSTAFFDEWIFSRYKLINLNESQKELIQEFKNYFDDTEKISFKYKSAVIPFFLLEQSIQK